MKRTATQTEIAAFERRIRELMAEGYSVKFAVYQAYKEHPVMQTLQREVAAQIRAEAERGYGDSLPQGITDRLFTHSWTPDGLTLSERTTHASILVREMVARTISEQIKKSTSYRQASLAIFDGYRQGGVIPVQDVPKYLAETMAIARHASIPRDEILKMLKPIRRQIEKGTTAGMRAAYSQLVDALEDQNEKALNKAIYAATQERTRYFADRIARTEMARAYQDGFLLKWDNNDDCVAYQWKLSGRHPRYDICDLYAKANLYGMGAGVFPKDKVPRLPAHPHCMCFLKPVIRGMMDNETPTERIEEGGREYLDSVDLHHRQMLLGIHGAKDVMDGKISWTQKARGYGGKKVDSRLSQEGAKSGKIDAKEAIKKQIAATQLDTCSVQDVVSLGKAVCDEHDILGAIGNPAELRTIFANYREMGGALRPEQWAKGSSAVNKQMLSEVFAHYPKAWVDYFNTTGRKLYTRKEKRGYFSKNGAVKDKGRHYVRSMPNYATDYFTIAMDGQRKTTPWHEIGHMVEHLNPDALRLSRAFVAERTLGEVPTPMRKLFVDWGYRPDEITKKDNFISPYIGKEYTDGSEVLSMGLEGLFCNEKFVKFAPNKDRKETWTYSKMEDDEEFLNLIVGLILLV